MGSRHCKAKGRLVSGAAGQDNNGDYFLTVSPLCPYTVRVEVRQRLEDEQAPILLAWPRPGGH